MNDDIKRVDEDWKRRAQDEKDKLKGVPHPPEGKGHKDRPGKSDPRFLEFLNSMATEALIYLGNLPHPQTGQTLFAPEQARHAIDILHLLEEKTKGNLSAEEEQHLKTIVHELRVAFVEMTEAAAAPPPDLKSKRK